MNLSVTICAKEHALVNLFTDLCPAPRVPFGRDTKLLRLSVRMMKLEYLWTTVISTKLATTTFL
jgi:hypothetical protein